MSQSRTKRALRATAQLGVFGIVAMAASLLTTGTAVASIASQIQALQQQQSALLSQLSALQGQAATAGQQAAATANQITVIQQKLTQDQTELSQINGALTTTNNRLATTQAQMATDRTQLAGLVTVLYQRGAGTSLADAIANSSGISQFVDNTLDLQTLRQQFASLTTQLIADADSLKVLQAEQQAQEQQVAALVSGLQSQSSQLQAAESTYSSEQNNLTGQAAQIQLLEEEESAPAGGGSAGETGTILHVYSGYPDLGGFPDDYPVGQCTWFAASEAAVSWNGNANEWIAGDASSPDPYPIGMTPAVDSIVVFRAGGAYNYLYGHVAWVVGVDGSSFVVDEANFVNGYDEDQRYIPNTQGVMGFIYTS
jgi:peptidoglycan hydrolase CwlO-like protein